MDVILEAYLSNLRGRVIYTYLLTGKQNFACDFQDRMTQFGTFLRYP